MATTEPDVDAADDDALEVIDSPALDDLKDVLLAPQRYEQVPVDALHPHAKNPRRGNIGAIRASIRKNKFVGAVIVQERTDAGETPGPIIAGEHRWRGAREENLATIPVLFVDVDDETALRMLLADNRASDLGGYDDRILADVLKELQARAEEAQKPAALDGTGWRDDDLSTLLGKLTDRDTPPPEFRTVDPGQLDLKHDCPRCGFKF